uniref:uncharacterized protein LOC120891486 n=1 Tax=Ictidomys tridecemlineatus TaxID=43179 RepID=UPI001A9CC4C6|nr:uncharacterized protein LOC120891486 [Ictidomys tridecemlineatus]XP_040146190.1 uncharacterized protein LOC120891486 [Ictidomys tridecemlineatus]XP_040146191.1 uncharacterized protein LOC120891486 [Ictidomys tridecemlineatus]XP_040146192.1 uncharacterized protein LOC120891486 [Ictidomys tridecemlineatus]XP_040146193.1 uncharacterized protein LOC120891486 [Ictidomys tridecemlineatus]XP_040146194.1 uncharacterized protein LOC120891486 [Ictidomys tridecemlineatus]
MMAHNPYPATRKAAAMVQGGSSVGCGPAGAVARSTLCTQQGQLAFPHKQLLAGSGAGRLAACSPTPAPASWGASDTGGGSEARELAERPAEHLAQVWTEYHGGRLSLSATCLLQRLSTGSQVPARDLQNCSNTAGGHTHTGYTGEWTETCRDGQTPLLLPSELMVTGWGQAHLQSIQDQGRKLEGSISGSATPSYPTPVTVSLNLDVTQGQSRRLALEGPPRRAQKIPDNVPPPQTHESRQRATDEELRPGEDIKPRPQLPGCPSLWPKGQTDQGQSPDSPVMGMGPCCPGPPPCPLPSPAPAGPLLCQPTSTRILVGPPCPTQGAAPSPPQQALAL